MGKPKGRNGRERMSQSEGNGGRKSEIEDGSWKLEDVRERTKRFTSEVSSKTRQISACRSLKLARPLSSVSQLPSSICDLPSPICDYLPSPFSRVSAAPGQKKNFAYR